MRRIALWGAGVLAGCRSEQEVQPWPRAEWDRCTVGEEYWQPVTGDPGGHVGSSIASVRDASGHVVVAALQGQSVGREDYLEDGGTAWAKQVALWWSDESRTQTAGSHVAAEDYCCYDPMTSASVRSGARPSGSGAFAFLDGDDTLPMALFEEADAGAGLAPTTHLPLLRTFGMSDRWIAGTVTGNDYDIAVHDHDGQLVTSLLNFGFSEWAPPPALYGSAVGDLDGDGYPELALTGIYATDESWRGETTILVYRGTENAITGPPLVLQGEDLGDLRSLPAGLRLRVSHAELASGRPGVLLVGSPMDPEDAASPGQACILRFEGTSASGFLSLADAPTCFENPADAAGADSFGIAFAAGDLVPERDDAEPALELAVGAPRMTDGRGAVVVMSLVEGEPRPDIGLTVLDGPGADRHYGAALATSGEGLLVGAPGDGSSLDGRIYDARCDD